jgi:hypothetical protein
MSTLFAWLISHQPAVLFSHNKPATSNQPAVLFSQNKPAPAISHQPTEQAYLLSTLYNTSSTCQYLNAEFFSFCFVTVIHPIERHQPNL